MKVSECPNQMFEMKKVMIIRIGRENYMIVSD